MTVLTPVRERVSMIRLHQDSGSNEISLVGIDQDWNWAQLKPNVVRLLRVRHSDLAATLLESNNFVLYEGTNGFGDLFHLLHLSARMDVYVELAAQAEEGGTEAQYRLIAKTVGEVGPHIRFVAVDLDGETGDLAIKSPSLVITSDTVERALPDCERLVNSGNPANGVDRIHTAFQGYLQALCEKAGIPVSSNEGLTKTFKVLRSQHPEFVAAAPHNRSVDSILNSMANILDSLNPIRNRESLAHPNATLLEEAEAMLVINATRTLLYYLNARFT